MQQTTDLLRNIMVIELASVLAGPEVGKFFAELGARVIKIENRQAGGDVTRNWKIAGESNGVSAYFSSVNYKKDYLSKNLKNADELQEVKELIRGADILLMNFKYGDDLKYGFDPESLKELNPKLICGSISGFSSQPNRVAYDVVIQAETGFMHLNGFSPELNNLKMPVAMMDIMAAHQLKEGLLLALMQREKTGQGGFVRVSLEEAGLTALVNQASNYLMTGIEPVAMGSLHPNIAPYGEAFQCADHKWIVLAVGSQIQFKTLCGILGAPEIAESPEFSTNEARVLNRPALQSVLSSLFGKKNQSDILNQCIEHNVPAAAVKSMAEVFQSDAANQLIRTEIIDGCETKRLSSIAFKFFR